MLLHASDLRLRDLLAGIDADLKKRLLERHGVGAREPVERLVYRIGLDGSNKLACVVRGGPASWAEIVRDVCDRAVLELPRSDDEMQLERQLVTGLILHAATSATPNARTAMARRVKVGRVAELLVQPGEVTNHVRTTLDRLDGLLLADVAEAMSIDSGDALEQYLTAVAGDQPDSGWSRLMRHVPKYRRTARTVLDVALLRLRREGGTDAEKAQGS